MSSGVVYLVGAGPGDPGLLTVRGRQLLASCDTIVYDALVNPLLVDDAWIGRVSEAEKIFVGKRGGAPSMEQDAITALLVRLARDGKRVVRLKGGDPMVFGRGGEEAIALAAAGLEFEVVPGVTAGVAAPAYAGIPVTHRGVSTSVTFITGHEDPGKDRDQTDWAALARAGGTLVLYMGVSRLAKIATALIEGGRSPSTPAAIIEWGTYPRQRTVTATLATLAETAARAKVIAPSIALVGDVVKLREEMSWFDRRPLFGRTIVVTRAREQASHLRVLLEIAGAAVIEAPAIRIEPLDQAPLRAALQKLASYNWLVVTSRNAVELLWASLRELGLDARAFASTKLCAVGPATADALLARGLSVDVIPDRYVAEGVIEKLRERDDVRGARVLFARAAGARELLPTAMREMGAVVDEIEIYRSVPDLTGLDTLRDALDAGSVDLVTFTSASTVRHFVDALGAERAGLVRGASIGPVTSDAARALGVPVAIEAAESTIASLVQAITTHLAR
ncbi:MAG: uroporphyrinogen-III C-methyltransferase / uroporphyrinogen-III synthase [Gemmatimonadetes bacterium]|nr:uroporphyrinogen-III C-methyltransferase / uroporphyrinogen-III synthase [Gemmatimonadota bacterium]